MNTTNFLKNQILQTLENNLGRQIKIDNLKFVILPSNADNEQIKNTWDEIMNWWVLPTKTEVKLTIDQIVEILTPKQGLFPLWIKLKSQNEELILLNISRRFRKIKDIKEFHKKNETMPCIFDNSLDLSFTDENVRSGLIRKLLWYFELDEEEKQIFEKIPLTFNDIKYFFDNHFKNYIYFPPDYNSRKPNTKSYRKWVIRKDVEFSIIDNIGAINETTLLTTKDLNIILHYYFDKEMNYKIDNLIIKNT